MLVSDLESNLRKVTTHSINASGRMGRVERETHLVLVK